MSDRTAHRFGDPRLPLRFWTKVEQRDDGCWLWNACRIRTGYGSFGFDGGGKLAHRVAFIALAGPVPDGLVLDHLCRVRHCVNPAHLEPVTQRENLMRGETSVSLSTRRVGCAEGHPLDESNTYVNKSGSRLCRTCRQAARKRYRDRQQATARRLADSR